MSGIFHCSWRPVFRAGTSVARGGAHHVGGIIKTAGAIGKASYLAGEKYTGLDGRTIDYRSKSEHVEYAMHRLPGGASFDPERLWNEADNHSRMQKRNAKGKTPNPVVAYDGDVAIPCEPGELDTREKRAAVAAEYLEWITERFKVAGSVGGHIPEVVKGTDSRNYHFHIQVSARVCSANGELGNLSREIDPIAVGRANKARAKRGIEKVPMPVEEMRDAWEHICNKHLAAAGSETRIDRRSLKDQGVHREPGKHRGAAATKRMREQQRSAQVRGHAVARDAVQSAERAKQREIAAQERIAAIQRARQEMTMPPVITGHLGSVAGWTHDAMGTFARAWASADRAAAARHKVSAARRSAMREPTEQERAELRKAGRELRSARKARAAIESTKDCGKEGVSL